MNPMDPYFPVFLKLSGKPCVVFGGGREAEQKTLSLLESGAKVRLVAEELSPTLLALADSGRVVWHQRHYLPGDLRGMFLAIAGDEDRSRNESIFAEGESSGTLVNCLDDPPHCRYIFSSVHRSGDLQIAVSSSGRCPALAVRIREKLQREYGPEYAEFLQIAARVREVVSARLRTFAQKKTFWYRYVDSNAIDLVRSGDAAQAEALAHQLLEEVAG